MRKFLLALKNPSAAFQRLRQKIFLYIRRWIAKPVFSARAENVFAKITGRKNEPVFFSVEGISSHSNAADLLCGHQFDLLGSGKVKLEPINWHEDFKSGKIWPLIFMDKIRYGEGDGSDVKVPWELSRFYHLIPLGLAYRETSDEKYVEEFKAEVYDWIQKNPPYWGVNWVNTMEVAIRACNLSFAWELFKTRIKNELRIKDEAKEFWNSFLMALEEHGKFIYRNLEYGKVRSNHFLSDIVGLVYVGILFPEFKESKKWLKKGIQGLESEMHSQVYEDGVDFEASLSYHRLVVELFGYAAWLCKLNGVVLSDYFWSKLKKMFEFTRWYIKPNGLAPQIGDNDDGRLHLLLEDYYNWDKRDHQHLFWLYKEIFGNSIDADFPEVKSKEFLQAGIYAMRSNDIYCIVDCGQNGQKGNGGHAHNDMLSFELNAMGKDFFVDPGAYIYTALPEWRNYFRSTRMHNTVVVDGEEQNRFLPETLFALKNDAVCAVAKWESNEKFDFLDVKHSGYGRLADPVVHKRAFYFDKHANTIEISDSFEANNVHVFEWNFHCDPNVRIIERSTSIIEFQNGEARILMEFPDSLTAEIYDSDYSPSYGVRVPAKAVRFVWQGDSKESRFLFVIRLI